jgi:3-oxoacyl-[acyl-carrier-protein] synthase-3
MVKYPVGISSLALKFPSLIRTNDYWRNYFPEHFSQSKTRHRQRVNHCLQSSSSATGVDLWSQEVSPYLADSFRGNVERRVLSQDETSLMLEEQAAREALAAANLSSCDIDLLIVSSLFSEQIAVGNAAYLACQLSLECPAWNLESTCSSALIALQNARALIQTGEYQRVLVVTSHAGSHAVDETDTLSWSMGDGAGAFVVSSLNPNQGVLSIKITQTSTTCDAYSYELAVGSQGKPKLRIQTGSNAIALAETAVDHVRTCCLEAVTKAGLTLDDINYFAFNTPTAWYASVCSRALNINPQRAINLYSRYANIGPVSAIANLYHAAHSGKIRENDLVLVYTNGAAATAAAIVMRWGNVTLGTPPAPPLSDTAKDEKVHLAIHHSSQDETFTGELFHSKAQLLAIPIEERQSVLERDLLEWLTNALRCSSVQLNAQQPLALSLDSLMTLELKRKIEVELQVQVPITMLFGDTTLIQLAEFVLQQIVMGELIVPCLKSNTQGNQQTDREQWIL